MRAAMRAAVARGRARPQAAGGHPTDPATHKRVYRVELAGATDVSDPADGPSGLLVEDGRTLAVLNDDDFGIDADGRGGIRPKVLPLTGAVDRNMVYFLPLPDEP